MRHHGACLPGSYKHLESQWSNAVCQSMNLSPQASAGRSSKQCCLLGFHALSDSQRNTTLNFAGALICGHSDAYIGSQAYQATTKSMYLTFCNVLIGNITPSIRNEGLQLRYLFANQQRHINMDREAHEPPHRKLVSVRHVSLIKPLPWSQTHEVVMIDGWPVVVPKGQFAVNQKVLYFAIDCVLPLEDKRYEPYRFSHFLVELHGQKGWTVQTVNRDMHISQGMVFAVGDFSWEIHLVREELEQDFDWFPDDLEKELMRLDLKGYFKIRKWSTFCKYINIQHG